jgi:kynurenine formamidase
MSRSTEALSRRTWLGTAGWLAALAAAGGSELRGAAVASAQAGSAESLLGALKSARVFDLSFTWNEQSPVLSLNPPYSFALNRTHKMTHEIFGQVPGSRVSWASEIMYFSGQHGAPTIDAIGHIGRDLKLHGGVDAVAATSTPGGIGANLGIDTFPVDLMINRAVLLDVARHVAAGAADPLPPGFEITAKHLDDTLRAQASDVRKGDGLMIRTGWGQFFGKDNAKYLGEQSPGPGQDAAKWIIARGVRLAGDDTATFEKRPAAYGKELFSVHMMLLTDSGIYIVENMNLEALSAAKAYTVALVVTPLKIQGASGSPLRALALAP